MKLEKREITLNEQDSLQDLLCMEMHLLQTYLKVLPNLTRKQTRGEVLRLFEEVAQDMFYLDDLIISTKTQFGKDEK